MPEEAHEALETGTPLSPPETPDTGAPTEASSESPEIDWKQRYEDLRPEADRRQSVLSDIEGRNGPDRQAAALAEVARIELEEAQAEEPEDEYDFDLPPDPNERLDALERERAEERAEQQDAEFNRLEGQYLESTVGKLEDEANIRLSDEQYAFVVNNALANRDPHDGKPDIDGSFAQFKAMMDSAGESWAQTKDTHIAPGGIPGEPKITPEQLRDKDKRQKLGTEIYEAAERAKSQ